MPRREPTAQQGSDVQHHGGGTALIFFAIFCLSILPPLVRVGLTENVSPIPLLAMRLLIATAVLWAVFGLGQPRVLRIDRRCLTACAAVAATDTFASFCYYYSFTHISTSIAHMIFSIYPVITLIFLSLRGERFSAVQIVGLCLALTGVLLLIGPGGQVNPVGALLAFGGALGYASTLAITQWFLSDYDPRTVTLCVVSLMTVATVIVWLIEREPLQSISPVGWWVIVITGLISTAVARLSLFAGIRRAGSGTVALLAPVETVLIILWAVLFLGDRLASAQWFGGALVVASMNLVMRRQPSPAVSLKKVMSRWR